MNNGFYKCGADAYSLDNLKAIQLRQQDGRAVIVLAYNNGDKAIITHHTKDGAAIAYRNLLDDLQAVRFSPNERQPLSVKPLRGEPAAELVIKNSKGVNND